MIKSSSTNWIGNWARILFKRVPNNLFILLILFSIFKRFLSIFFHFYVNLQTQNIHIFTTKQLSQNSMYTVQKILCFADKKECYFFKYVLCECIQQMYLFWFSSVFQFACPKNDGYSFSTAKNGKHKNFCYPLNLNLFVCKNFFSRILI